MRRTYDRQRYLDRVALIREHLPDAAITTDVIVGFPGETERDFGETMAVVEEVGYDGAFTFIFSPRRGTQAAEITEGVVPHAEKVERMERLLEVVQRRAASAPAISSDARSRCWWRASRVPTRRACAGRTRHNRVVNFDGVPAPGELTGVLIKKATSQTLAGGERLAGRAQASVGMPADPTMQT